MMEVTIRIVVGDATKTQMDVLALKYAQANYGIDSLVSEILAEGGRESSLMRPKAGGFRLVDSIGELAASQVLFVGVVPLYSFGYPEIREFSRRALSSLAGIAPKTRRIGFTLHGANYGLDEFEAFEAEIAGIVDAIQTLDFPEALSEILFIERNRGRANRLDEHLKGLLPSGIISPARAERGAQPRPEDSEGGLGVSP